MTLVFLSDCTFSAWFGWVSCFLKTPVFSWNVNLLDLLALLTTIYRIF